MNKHRASRYHDISCGHRVVGHESKCRFLHGHNYRIHFHCESEDLDDVGRVIDFGDIKSQLCMWVEDYWDHKFLMWDMDPLLEAMDASLAGPAGDGARGSIVRLPFNPTAENMASYLVNIIGPRQLAGTGIRLVAVDIEETRKCSASYGE